MSRATDPRLRARVRALAPRLLIERARHGPLGQRGTGRLRAVSAALGGDVELDLSLEAIVSARASGRAAAPEELTALTWQRPMTALCLLVDRSGSMDGHRLAAATLAAAACAVRACEAGGELSVIAFDQRAEVIVDIETRIDADEAVRRVLGLQGHGITSIRAAMTAAARQLARAHAHRRITLLLSDCRATDGQDPLESAKALNELAIIAPASDDEEAREFGREVGARVACLDSLRGLPGILDELLRP